MKHINSKVFRKQDKAFLCRKKTNDSKNKLLVELENLFPFLIKKGEKKKIKKKFYRVIEEKSKFSEEKNFNERKMKDLYEMIDSSTPYVNFIGTGSKQQFTTVPIKLTIQKRLKASWLFLDLTKNKTSNSFEDELIQKLRLWESNKEKILQNRNQLYKTTIQHDQDSDDD